MNEETIADILREWRSMTCYCEVDIHPLTHKSVMRNLDRIEAACRREAAKLIPAANIEFSDGQGLRQVAQGWVKVGGLEKSNQRKE